MAKLNYYAEGEKTFETGVKEGVLFVFDQATKKYGTGVAWRGLTAVTESPSGAESTALYADDVKYLNLLSAEEFGATIEAYTYPDEFAECDGSVNIAGMKIGQQSRKMFAFVYKTVVGNDTEGTNRGYKLHIIYGCMAAPSEKAYASINDSPEAITMSWEVTTTPVPVTIGGVTYKPTATVTVSTEDFRVTGTPGEGEVLGGISSKFKALEDYIYGTASEEPTLPMPKEVHDLLTTGAVVA